MTPSAAGRVASLHRYPVKSMQGTSVERLVVGTGGVEGDRERALLDAETGALLSAKRYGRLLEADVADDAVVLPGGERIPFDAPDAATRLSAWIGRPVELATCGPDVAVAYEMTFDPPNDDAEYYAIDAPVGSFLDLAPVHLVCTQTLDACRAARPDLDWDARRFRPNVVVDVPGLEPFGDDAWTGRRLRLGSVVLEGMQPTVRCAMPLRAQPGLASQPALYGALEDLHANHLGQYLSVVEPGEVRVGDPVEVL
jgi:uncharacterized protein YcbX